MRDKVKMDTPIILFMISDGEPSASVPAGYDGKTYTRKAVTAVQKSANTTVVHIAIEEGIPSHTMFDHFVSFTDHDKLVLDIGNLLKKIMLKQQAPMEV